METIELTIPESWADVTVGQFQKMDPDDVASVIETMIGLDRSTVYTLTKESIDDILESLGFLHELPQTDYLPNICGYDSVDINKISAGELERLENMCKDFRPNASRVAAWIYRGDEGCSVKELDARGAILSASMDVNQLLGMLMHIIITLGILLDVENILNTNNG